MNVARTDPTRECGQTRIRVVPKNQNLGVHPDGTHCAAQICLKGHVLHCDGASFESKGHCTKCGSTCIDKCQHCNEPIRGAVQFQGRGSYTRPQFCHACGRAYPWMSERLMTARQLLNKDDKLTVQDRTELWDLLQDVMSNPTDELTPRRKNSLRSTWERPRASSKTPFWIWRLKRWQKSSRARSYLGGRSATNKQSNQQDTKRETERRTEERSPTFTLLSCLTLLVMLRTTVENIFKYQGDDGHDPSSGAHFSLPRVERNYSTSATELCEASPSSRDAGKRPTSMQ